MSKSTRHGRTAAVRPHLGKPALFVDDQPRTPIFYAPTHATGGRWSWEEVPARNLRLFGERGVELYQVDLYFEDIWYEGVERLDLAKAARQVQGVVDACADAAVVVRVHVNAPFWWNEANRDQATGYATGDIDPEIISGVPVNNETGDTKRALRASLASQRWREEAGARLVEFCRDFSAMSEADAVIGIHVCAGIYGEWHYWGMFDMPDTGPVMTTHFRAWLTQRYPDEAALQQAWADPQVTFATAAVPGLEAREHPSDGIFRDPQRERQLIDYGSCQQEVVAEDIEYFCALVRAHWNRPCLVGVFYGYFFNMFNQHDNGGHLEIDRIMRCPDIDYLSSPQCQFYEACELGGGGYARGLADAARLHGKLWLDEIDHGHMQKGYDASVVGIELTPDPDYLPVLRRSTVHPISRGHGAWYYDFGLVHSRGWWDHPRYLARIQEEMDFYQTLQDRPFESGADVLVVYSCSTFLYTNNRLGALMPALIDRSTERIYHSGAIADHVYDTDLPDVDLDRYRAVVFMNTFQVTPQQRDWIHEHVCRDGRTVIWNALPGYCDGERIGSELASALTGFELQRLDRDPVPTAAAPAWSEEELTYEEVLTSRPLLGAADGPEVLVRCEHSGLALTVRRRADDHTVVFCALPIASPRIWRELLAAAGAQIWCDSDDAVYGGYGLLWLHSVTGGERSLRLAGGETRTVSIPAKSTTVFDAATGECLLGEVDERAASANA